MEIGKYENVLESMENFVFLLFPLHYFHACISNNIQFCDYSQRDSSLMFSADMWIPIGQSVIYTRCCCLFQNISPHITHIITITICVYFFMLGGTLSTLPAQLTTIVASMFVNNAITTLPKHTVDKNTSFVWGRDLRFRPKTWRLFYF